MTLKEWTAEVIEDFQAAGYTVTEYQGFPLVEMPTEGTIQERAELIKFRGGRWAVEKQIFDKGMLLLPVGQPGNPTRAEDGGGKLTMSLTVNSGG